MTMNSGGFRGRTTVTAPLTRLILSHIGVLVVGLVAGDFVVDWLFGPTEIVALTASVGDQIGNNVLRWFG